MNKTYITHWCWFLDFLLFVGLFLAGAVPLLISISMTLHTDNSETDNSETDSNELALTLLVHMHKEGNMDGRNGVRKRIRQEVNKLEQ